MKNQLVLHRIGYLIKCQYELTKWLSDQTALYLFVASESEAIRSATFPFLKEAQKLRPRAFQSTLLLLSSLELQVV